MTLYGLLASALWTASAVLFVERSSRFAHRWLDVIHREHEGTKPLVIPDDLEAFALSHSGPTDDSTPMIQDQVRALIKDRYAQYQDWNKVRAAVGIGSIDGVTA